MTWPNVTVLTEPACEPVSLAQARTWCKIPSSDTSEDSLISMLIQAARERAEDITGRAFVERQLEVVYDAFPANGKPIELPAAPLISVEYVKYVDTTGTWQTMNGSPDEWILDTDSKPGRISPLVSVDWPSTQDRMAAVKIDFTCGYSFSGSPSDDEQRAALPASLINWMHVRIASFYENREALIVGQAFQQPPRDFVDGLLDGLIVYRRFG